MTWETDRTPGAVLDFYRSELTNAGYVIREEHSASRRGDFEGGFWAESEAEDRVVFIAASQEVDRTTRILLGYGGEVF